MADPVAERLDTHLAFLDAEAEAQDRREELAQLRAMVESGNRAFFALHTEDCTPKPMELIR